MTMPAAIPDRQIRARFTDTTIRVYQAYSSAIADPALDAQRFVRPFKVSRMTWIKPSFCWMMYRSGWGTKEGQERVLAIDITRNGFEWALRNGCLSHFDSQIHSSRDAWQETKEKAPVRIQWDPERDCDTQRLDYRSIQIGLSGEAITHYTHEWIQAISDMTDFIRRVQTFDEIARRRACGDIIEDERPYPLPKEIGMRIGMIA